MGSCCTKSTGVADASPIVPAGSGAKSGAPKNGVIHVSARSEPDAKKEQLPGSGDDDSSPKDDNAADEQKQQPPHALKTTSSTSASSSPSPNPHGLKPPENGVPATNLELTPTAASRKLAERRASGSQMLTAEAQARLHPHGVPEKKVSRPSTPISRSDHPSRLGLGPPSAIHTASPLASPANSATLGWGVAPNAPEAAGGVLSPPTGSASARASRRRSAEQLSTLIPETIQEKIRAKKDAASAAEDQSAAANAAGAPSLGALPSSRRGSGTFERTVTINKIQPTSSPIDSSSPSTSSPNNTTQGSGSSANDLSHRKFGGGGGAAIKGAAVTARYELTDQQESELRKNPYLWTDAHVWRYHINAMFSYYSQLPVTTSSPVVSASPTPSSSPIPVGGGTSASTLPSLPSIHSGDRLVFSQLQRLAQDCIHRLFLLLRKEIRVEKSLHDEGELKKAVWKRLEELLPGHGNEVQTQQYCSLFLLSSLAKTVAGSVGRREFILLFPSVYPRLFCDPKEVVKGDRKKLIQEIYKLKLDQLMQPFPPGTTIDPALSVVTGSGADGGNDSPLSGTYSQSPVYSINTPIRLVAPGDRRKSLAGPLPSVSHNAVSGKDAQAAQLRGNLERRNSLRLPGSSYNLSAVSRTNGTALGGGSPTTSQADLIGDSLSRRGSFNAGSVDRLLKDLNPDNNEQKDGSRRGSKNGGNVGNEERISRRGSYTGARRERSPSK